MEAVRIVAHKITKNQLNSIIKMRDELDSIINQIRGDVDAFITPEIVVSRFSEMVNVSPEVLTSKIRDVGIVHKRRMLMKLLRELLRMSYKDIGAIVGGLKIHAVSLGIKIISEEIDEIESLRNFYKKVKNDIRL